MLFFLLLAYSLGYIVTLVDLLVAIPKSSLPEIFPAKLPTSYFYMFCTFPIAYNFFSPLEYILNANIVFILCLVISVLLYPLTFPLIIWSLIKYK